MATKVIGYQIINQNQDITVGLYSFPLFRSTEPAFNYLREHKLNKGLPASQCLFVKEYYEGDIEDPSYIGYDKKRYNKVTLYYHTNPTVEVEAKDEHEAINLDCSESTHHTQELLYGLQEDSSPDVETI